MIKRLTAVAAAALVVGVLGAAPAWADDISAVMVSPNNGQVVTDTVGVKGQVTSSEGIEYMVLYVAGVKVEDMSPTSNTAELSYIWDTNYMPESSSLSSNGDYSAYIDATSKSGHTSTDEIIILVDNPPTVPKGLTVATSGGTVHLNWQSNPEPDTTGYKVERSSGGGFVSIGTASGPSFQDSPGGGNHTYRVSALRSSPASGTRSSVPTSGVGAYVEGPPSASSGGGYPSGDGGGSGSAGGSGGISDGVGGIGGDGSDLSRTKFKDIGAFGLPSGITLPGISGLMGLPQLPVADTLGWGTYEETLPYDLPRTGTQLFTEEIPNIAARADYTIIPPDGLRWVAAGLLLIVGASMLRYGAVRIGAHEPQTILVAPAPTRPAPPVAFGPSDRTLKYLRDRW